MLTPPSHAMNIVNSEAIREDLIPASDFCAQNIEGGVLVFGNARLLHFVSHFLA